MIRSIFSMGPRFTMAPEGDPAGGGGAGDWKASLPEDLRGSASLGKFKDVAGLAKSYTELEGMMGSSIRPPGPDAAPEVHKEFADRLEKAGVKGVVYLPDDPKARAEVEGKLWERLGRPKEALGYKLDGVDLKGVTFSDAELEAARAEARELGLTAAQFQGVMARQAAQRAGAAQSAKERLASIKAELGASYDDVLAEALAGAEKSGAPAAAREALKSGAADKDTLLYFRNLAKSIGALPRNSPDLKGGQPGISKGEAEMRIGEILANPKFHGGTVEERAHLSAELARLEAIASPELVGT